MTSQWLIGPNPKSPLGIINVDDKGNRYNALPMWQKCSWVTPTKNPSGFWDAFILSFEGGPAIVSSATFTDRCCAEEWIQNNASR